METNYTLSNEKSMVFSNASARADLEKGLRWRIGNEKSMNIQNDPWLSRPGDGRIRCHDINIKYTTISHLINQKEGTWDEMEVRAVVKADQLQIILAIPLPKVHMTDCRIWRPEGSGSYSVRSAYKLLLHDHLYLQQALKCSYSSYYKKFLYRPLVLTTANEDKDSHVEMLQ